MRFSPTKCGIYSPGCYSCWLALPLIQPHDDPKYFSLPHGGKASGHMAEVIGHQLQSVMHADLKQIYAKELRELAMAAPVAS